MKLIRTVTFPAENEWTKVNLIYDDKHVETITICETVAIEDWLEENRPNVKIERVLHIDRNDPDFLEKVSPKVLQVGFADLQGVGCYDDGWWHS